jgi:predicted AlkP superfamily phosphohydrolase/phosphomutase
VGRSRLLVIALDGLERSLVERLVAEGELPAIGRVLREGLVGETMATHHHLAEVPWTEMLTGCRPGTTGYWSPFAFAADYSVREIAAHDFAQHPPFYACCPGRKILVFDVPQARLHQGIDGIQLLGWGSHTPQAASVSAPGELLAEVTRRFGPHPAFPEDWMMVTETRRRTAALTAALLDGIARRTAIARDLMARLDWDLAFIVCSETHSAGHNFWHLGHYGHPLAAAFGECFGDPLKRILKAADGLVAGLREAAPPQTPIMLFAERGMKPNTCDLPSLLFLPELLYRRAFDRAALGRPRSAKLGASGTGCEGDWGLIAWSLQEDTNVLRRTLRRHARPGISRRFDRLFGSALDLVHPYDTRLGYLPPMWYCRHWPRMPAFALPSYADGLIRINLAGRETSGIVSPSEYERFCDSLIVLLKELRNPRTGEPVVEEAIRTRRSGKEALLADPSLPDADLVVRWRDTPADVIESPEYGRIGPLPFRRSGDHTPRGFFAISGPGLPAQRLKPGHLVDLAPTILDLLAVPAPGWFEGGSRAGAFIASAAA